jgi:(p)ppGpp synthase/HD superfamily hydrolase
MSSSTSPAKATLADAIELAAKAHHGVVDKSGQPYILHPLRVMFRCESDVERTVAVLHDVVEDTDYTLDDLREMGFSAHVISALDCVTKRQGESYEAFVNRSASDPIAVKVKIADLEDNMDVRRLPGFTEKDLQRMAKYLAAWRKLKALTA